MQLLPEKPVEWVWTIIGSVIASGILAMMVPYFLIENTLPDVPAMVGVWEGTVIENNSSYPTSINLSLTDTGGLTGDISYPTQPCSGLLNTFQLTGLTAVLQERLTLPGKCIQDGSVKLRLLGTNTIAYEWLSPEGIIKATSTLSRIE